MASRKSTTIPEKNFSQSKNQPVSVTAAHARVKHIAQGVANQVPAHHEQHQGETGPDNDVPVMAQVADPVAGKAENLTPIGIADLCANAEEKPRMTLPKSREA